MPAPNPGIKAVRQAAVGHRRSRVQRLFDATYHARLWCVLLTVRVKVGWRRVVAGIFDDTGSVFRCVSALLPALLSHVKLFWKDAKRFHTKLVTKRLRSILYRTRVSETLWCYPSLLLSLFGTCILDLLDWRNHSIILISTSCYACCWLATPSMSNSRQQADAPGVPPHPTPHDTQRQTTHATRILI